MGAAENKQTVQAAYAAFSAGDAAGAMANMDDSVEWTTAGDNALTGTVTGKQAVGELWGKLAAAEGGFATEPHDFIADGDTVVVLATTRVGDDEAEVADVLTYNGEGKLVAFRSYGDPAVANARFPK